MGRRREGIWVQKEWEGQGWVGVSEGWGGEKEVRRNVSDRHAA